MRIRSVVLLAACSVALLFSASTASALTSPLTTGSHRITYYNGGQADPNCPDISGLKMVYLYKSADLSWNVGCYDLASGTLVRLSDNASAWVFPRISGSRVVYGEYDQHGDTALWCYDLITNTASRLATTTDHPQPDISGDRVVYSDAGQVYAYGCTTSLTSRLATGTSPVVSGDRVVYSDGDNFSCYDFATATATLLPGCRGSGSFDGTTVVYSALHERHSDIFAYDVSTRIESVVTTGTMWKYAPTISGTKVAYFSPRVYRGDEYQEVWLTDIAMRTTSRLTFRTGTNLSPAISGSLVVYRHCALGGEHSDVYVCETKPPASLSTPVPPSRASHTRSYTVYGDLKPRHRSGTDVGTLQCERYYSGAWHLVKTYRLKCSNRFGYSRYYAVGVKLSHVGRWRIRSRHADADHALSYSRWRSVTVR